MAVTLEQKRAANWQKIQKWRAGNRDKWREMQRGYNAAYWKRKRGDDLPAVPRKQKRQKPPKQLQFRFGRQCKGKAYFRFFRYGVNAEQYSEMVAKQNGRCAICRDVPKGKMSLSLDHCHASGRVRGLLCMFCNFALGYFRDSPDLLRFAIAYLQDGTQKVE